ncbi:hypothetical protein ABW19_dt0204836 [Dactylella cylindrospora]|nr:hypothetical protein ABW19_dt0204836 [Dactylella cylindrospora]
MAKTPTRLDTPRGSPTSGSLSDVEGQSELAVYFKEDQHLGPRVKVKGLDCESSDGGLSDGDGQFSSLSNVKVQAWPNQTGLGYVLIPTKPPFLPLVFNPDVIFRPPRGSWNSKLVELDSEDDPGMSSSYSAASTKLLDSVLGTSSSSVSDSICSLRPRSSSVSSTSTTASYMTALSHQESQSFESVFPLYTDTEYGPSDEGDSNSVIHQDDSLGSAESHDNSFGENESVLSGSCTIGLPQLSEDNIPTEGRAKEEVPIGIEIGRVVDAFSALNIDETPLRRTLKNAWETLLLEYTVLKYLPNVAAKNWSLAASKSLQWLYNNINITTNVSDSTGSKQTPQNGSPRTSGTQGMGGGVSGYHYGQGGNWKNGGYGGGGANDDDAMDDPDDNGDGDDDSGDGGGGGGGGGSPGRRPRKKIYLVQKLVCPCAVIQCPTHQSCWKKNQLRFRQNTAGIREHITKSHFGKANGGNSQLDLTQKTWIEMVQFCIERCRPGWTPPAGFIVDSVVYVDEATITNKSPVVFTRDEAQRKVNRGEACFKTEPDRFCFDQTEGWKSWNPATERPFLLQSKVTRGPRQDNARTSDRGRDLQSPNVQNRVMSPYDLSNSPYRPQLKHRASDIGPQPSQPDPSGRLHEDSNDNFEQYRLKRQRVNPQESRKDSSYAFNSKLKKFGPDFLRKDSQVCQDNNACPQELSSSAQSHSVSGVSSSFPSAYNRGHSAEFSHDVRAPSNVTSTLDLPQGRAVAVPSHPGNAEQQPRDFLSLPASDAQNNSHQNRSQGHQNNSRSGVF